MDEFTPVELIITDDILNLPNIYINLLKKWLKRQYDNKCKTVEDIKESWDYGTEIRIIHWQWKFNKQSNLIIDISGFPAEYEHGIICLNDDIVFENNNKNLTLINTKSPLVTKLILFEMLRKFNPEGNTQAHYVNDAFETLKEDMLLESIDEEEYTIEQLNDALQESDSDETEYSDDF